MAGWIKLHRSLLEWEWYDDVNVRLVFVHCLLQANFKDRSHKGVMFERGSFPCGRDQLAKDIGISTQQLRTSLGKLESTGEITIKSTSKGTKVTLCNYDSYQDVQPADQPTSNQQVTNDQPTSNHSIRKKEGKKVIKEDILKDIPKNIKPLAKEWIEYRSEIKKPIKTARGLTQFKKHDYNSLRWAMDQAMSNEYQGMFPENYKPSFNQQTNTNPFKSILD